MALHVDLALVVVDIRDRGSLQARSAGGILSNNAATSLNVADVTQGYIGWMVQWPSSTSDTEAAFGKVLVI